MHANLRRFASLARPAACLSQRQLSSTPAAFLVRDYLQKSLYDPQMGYFTSRDVIIAPDSPDPLPFSTMKGEYEYRKHIAELYEKNLGKWMTPVEIFAPYYSMALANYLLS